MKNISKKLMAMTSVLGAVVLLSACTTMCPAKKHHNMHQVRQIQPVEMIASDTIVVYQTYENADVKETFLQLMSRQRKSESEDAGWL